MRLRRKSIRGIIRVKDGLKEGSDKTSNVGIEGERIEVSSKGLGSPFMASLDMSSLNSFQCSIWE
jgi:hypothetical protein